MRAPQFLLSTSCWDIAIWCWTIANTLLFVQKLATLPEAFDAAVENLFNAFAKAANLASWRNHAKFWKSKNKTQGPFGRYIKNFDQVLARMITTHWLQLVKEGRDVAWLPMDLEERIREEWSSLLADSLHPFELQGNITKNNPNISSTSLA